MYISKHQTLSSSSLYLVFYFYLFYITSFNSCFVYSVYFRENIRFTSKRLMVQSQSTDNRFHGLIAQCIVAAFQRKHHFTLLISLHWNSENLHTKLDTKWSKLSHRFNTHPCFHTTSLWACTKQTLMQDRGHIVGSSGSAELNKPQIPKCGCTDRFKASNTSCIFIHNNFKQTA